jgi:hypothetical protein
MTILRNPLDFDEADEAAIRNRSKKDRQAAEEVVEALAEAVKRIGRDMPRNWSRSQVRDRLCEIAAGELWEWDDDELIDAAVDLAIGARDRDTAQ